MKKCLFDIKFHFIIQQTYILFFILQNGHNQKKFKSKKKQTV